MGAPTPVAPDDDRDPEHGTPPEPVLVSVETPRPGTHDPHRSRVRALKVLFQADLRGQDPSAAVAGIAIDPAAVALLDDLDLDDADTGAAADGLDDYARTLIDGVSVRRHALDRIISRFSHRWEVNRMPVVDRNILRLGTFELLFEDVSPAVVIDEALELAKQHSTDASHRFVNGILEAVRRDAPDLRTELDRPFDDDAPPTAPDPTAPDPTAPDPAAPDPTHPVDTSPGAPDEADETSPDGPEGTPAGEVDVDDGVSRPAVVTGTEEIDPPPGVDTPTDDRDAV